MNIVLRNVTAGAALVAALSFAPSQASAFFGDDAAPPAAQHLKQMAKDLQLTDQQKTEIKAIFEKNRQTLDPLLKQMAAERKALRALIHADTIDEAAIRAQSAKVSAIDADLAVDRAHVAQQVRTLLTPEQIAKWKELQAARDAKMSERGGRLGERGHRRR